MIMLKRLIIFLIRRKLGVGLYQDFRFTNQKNKSEFYWFDTSSLKKVENNTIINSRVSLNWLLDDDCHIETGFWFDEHVSDLDFDNSK